MATAFVQDKLESVTRAKSYALLPQVLRWVWAVSAVTFVLTLLVAWLEFHAGWVQGRWDPLQFPLFYDLQEYIPTFRLLHAREFFYAADTVAYPPFASVLFAAVYATGHAVGVYLALAVLALAVVVWGVRGELVRYGISPLTAVAWPMTLILASFPLWRLIPQGNIELFLWIFAAAGAWLFLRGVDDSAAILWGMAAATKLYPIIFLVLFLPRKKYRACVVGVVSFVVTSLLALAYLGPTIPIAFRGALADVFGFQGSRMVEWTIHDLAGNHSLFTLVKVMAMIEGISTTALTKPYYLVGAVVFGAVYFGRVRKMSVTNQLLLVSLFMVMLPPVSYFHPLVHLYAPWLLLVFLAIRAERSGARIPGLKATILLFLPLFSSSTLYTFPTLFIYAGLIQSFLLVVLFICAATFPFDEPMKEPLAVR